MEEAAQYVASDFTVVILIVMFQKYLKIYRTPIVRIKHYAINLVVFFKVGISKLF